MGKNVLIITSSLRDNSNSDMLAVSFADGARKAGNNVETISLKDKTINFCMGCMVCQGTLKCVIEDDAISIAEKAKSADVLVFVSPVYYYSLVFVSPVYYYSISGQLKTLLDRLNPLYPSDYNFRDVYFLATAADGDESAMEGPVKAIEGWVECFEKARLAGTVFCGGVDGEGEIKGNNALDKAREMGKAIG